MTRRLAGNPEVLAEMLQDPQFRAEWERTALARAVAEAVIRYRAEHGLSQTGLAGLLGWRQPVVARLEAAEHNPSMDTLLTLARALGLRVHVEVGPKTGVIAKVTKSRAA
ncbi:MAG TPA: helix-turn-helix transcriptional regulator [Streptosporangiaceae bacterium]